MSQISAEPEVANSPCPAAFFWLQPLSAGGIFFQASTIAMAFLRTEDLAKRAPNNVLFMPWLLQHFPPEVIAANALGIFSLITGFLGPVSGMVSVRLGLKVTNNIGGVVVIIGALLMATEAFYFLGLLIGSLGIGFFNASFLALFSSQWDDPQQAQRLISYNYALVNATGIIASTLAGVQTFQLLCVEAAAIMCVGLVTFRLAPMRFRDAPLEAAETGREPLAAGELARARAFGVLVIFISMFFVFSFQYLGGAFFIFVEVELGTLGSLPVPPAWFLAWGGMVDLFLAIFVMDRVYGPSTKFYTKLQLAFLFLVVASGLLVAVVTLTSGKINPVFALLSVTFLSVGDMHFTPVVMTLIPNEMPERYIGLFTGLFFVATGVSGFVGGGLGASLYLHVGPAMFFGILSAMAAAGLVSLGFLRPYFDRTFQARATEAIVERPGRADTLSSSLVHHSG